MINICLTLHIQACDNRLRFLSRLHVFFYKHNILQNLIFGKNLSIPSALNLPYQLITFYVYHTTQTQNGLDCSFLSC